MSVSLSYKSYHISASFSDSLNLIRWLAAFLVVISHARSILFLDRQMLASANIYIDFFYFITGFGYEAVIVFFILSGYLVGGSILKDASHGRLSISGYLISRTSRIYIVLIPALILTALLDYTGTVFLNDTGIYAGKVTSSSLLFSIQEHFTLSAFIFNLLMLQGSMDIPVFGSNSPLWSLAYEWWYYILFFFLFYSVRGKVIWKRIISMFIISGIILIIHPVILLYGCIWLCGLIIYIVPKLSSWIFYVSMICFAAIVTAIRLKQPDLLDGTFYSDLLLTLSCVFFLSQLQFRSIRWIRATTKLHAFLAEFSYTLYLVHFPLFVFLTAVMLKYTNQVYPAACTFYTFMVFTGFIIIAYGIAFLLYNVTEKHTKKIRLKIITLLNRTGTSP